MMTILTWFLTAILVLDSFLLMLLVLVQLPKKEAGAGVAFGGGTTDALFGAGTGTALTKITKYAAGGFLGIALLLSVITGMQTKGGRVSAVEEQLQQKSGAPAQTAPPLTTPAPAAPPATPVPTEGAPAPQ